MAKSKKLDLRSYTNVINNLTANGEMIRTRQDEKQAAMDDFDKERNLYHAGKISESSVRNSSRKVNAELKKLNKGIGNSMSNIRTVSKQLLALTSRQRPINFSASVSGIKKPRSGKKKGKSSMKKK